MKKISLLMLCTIYAMILCAQSEKFTSAMAIQLQGYDSVRSVEGLQEKANAFERIAEAEKTQWLPYYYAALSNVNLGYQYVFSGGTMGGNAEKSDPLADKAELLLKKAEELSKDNSEIYVVKKMVFSLRMMGDVMNRFMTEGPAAAEALATAKKLNPENPRIYVMEGIDLFNTPEQFGGSKEKAKVLFEEALKKYDAFRPESNIHPTWGAGTARYFLSQIK